MQDLAVTNKQVTDELKQNNAGFNKKLTINDSDLNKINTLIIQVLSQKRTYLTCNMDFKSPMILPLWYHIKIRIHHWKVDIIQQLVAFGLSNMK